MFSLLREAHWTFDLFTHFHYIYILALLCLILIHIVNNKYKWGILFLALLCYPLIQVIGSYKEDTKISINSSQTIRLLSANIDMNNSNHEYFKNLITKNNPDVILLLETNNAWTKNITYLGSEYPYNLTHPRSDYFGVTLYSKHPLSDEKIIYGEKNLLPTLQATINSTAGKFILFGIHLDWPLSQTSVIRQRQQIDWLNRVVRETSDNLIVMGDFNTTPWSVNYRNLLSNGKLKACNRTFKPGTWPGRLSYIALPIDHCFYSGDVKITRYYVSDYFGSDHKAIVVDLSVRQN